MHFYKLQDLLFKNKEKESQKHQPPQSEAKVKKFVLRSIWGYLLDGALTLLGAIFALILFLLATGAVAVMGMFVLLRVLFFKESMVVA